MAASVTTLPEPPSSESLADLLHRLGDVPPDRVRLRPYPGTATLDDVLDIAAREGRLYELVEDTLVEKAIGMVWIIDPRTRTVAVFTGPEEFTLLHESDTLDAGDVIPGFTLPLRELFAELDRTGS